MEAPSRDGRGVGALATAANTADEQRPEGTDEEADDRQSAVLIAGRGAGEGKLDNLLLRFVCVILFVLQVGGLTPTYGR